MTQVSEQALNEYAIATMKRHYDNDPVKYFGDSLGTMRMKALRMQQQSYFDWTMDEWLMALAIREIKHEFKLENNSPVPIEYDWNDNPKPKPPPPHAHQYDTIEYERAMRKFFMLEKMKGWFT